MISCSIRIIGLRSARRTAHDTRRPRPWHRETALHSYQPFPVGVRAALGLARGRVGARGSVVALPGFRVFQGRGTFSMRNRANNDLATCS